jgi:hypothetical protein
MHAQIGACILLFFSPCGGHSIIAFRTSESQTVLRAYGFPVLSAVDAA